VPMPVGWSAANRNLLVLTFLVHDD
jgi:hypothetical protein